MKKKTISLIATLIILATFFYGCALTRTINAAMILVHTTMGVKELSLDSVKFDQDIVDLVNQSKKGIFPSKKVLSLAKNFIDNKIETELGKAYLGLSLNVKNDTQDTLYLPRLKTSIHLDNIITLSIDLDKTYALYPGENEVQLTTEFPLDMRLFQLPSIEQYTIDGTLYVALERFGRTVPIKVNVTRQITSEQKKAIVDNVKDKILKLLASGAGSLFSKD